MRTLYADFNDFDERGDLPLTCRGSVESLRALQTPPSEGEDVWLSDGELRARATLMRAADGIWLARAPEWKFEPVTD
jgi:hypothetical protein